MGRSLSTQRGWSPDAIRLGLWSLEQQQRRNGLQYNKSPPGNRYTGRVRGDCPPLPPPERSTSSLNPELDGTWPIERSLGCALDRAPGRRRGRLRYDESLRALATGYWPRKGKSDSHCACPVRIMALCRRSSPTDDYCSAFVREPNDRATATRA